MRQRLPWIIVMLVIAAAVGAWFMFRNTSADKVTYTTGTVTKGTLVVSVSASGTTTSVNRVSVTTGVTGTVSKVYVKDGDTVKKGQTLMTVALDSDGEEALAKANSTLVSAQSAVTQAKQGITTNANDIVSAKNAVTQAEQNKVSLHRDLLNAQSNVTTAQSDYDTAVSDNKDSTVIAQKKTALEMAEDSLTIAESKYGQADTAISQAKTNLTLTKAKKTTAQQAVTKAEADLVTAQAAYDEASGTITAPVAGTIADLTYAADMIISSSSSSSGTGSASSGTKIASIVTGTLPTASFSLAEADAPKVEAGQKATLTFDAIEDKTFTGTVIGVDRTGTVSSNVTTYPMTIRLDAASDEILPNMTVTADVITKTTADVLMVPNAAVKTSNGTSTVQVMDNDAPSSVTVEIGDASDSYTIITSGLTEGQTVVTATISSTNTNSSTSSSGTSLFSGTLSGSSTRAVTGSSMGGSMPVGGPPGN